MTIIGPLEESGGFCTFCGKSFEGEVPYGALHTPQFCFPRTPPPQTTSSKTGWGPSAAHRGGMKKLFSLRGFICKERLEMGDLLRCYHFSSNLKLTTVDS